MLDNSKNRDWITYGNAKGPTQTNLAYETSKSISCPVDFPISLMISKFLVDFWISNWISGFVCGFLISHWISGFHVGFLFGFPEFISGFLDRELDCAIIYRYSAGVLKHSVCKLFARVIQSHCRSNRFENGSGTWYYLMREDRETYLDSSLGKTSCNASQILERGWRGDIIAFSQ